MNNLQRLIHNLIDEHSRVHLPEVNGVAGSDFINANYIDVSLLSLPLFCLFHLFPFGFPFSFFSHPFEGG